MNIVTGALIGSVAGHAFNYTLTPFYDKTLTPLYYKGSDLLGIDVNSNESVRIDPSEFTSASTDPYTGYFSSTLAEEMQELHKKIMEEKEDKNKIEEKGVIENKVAPKQNNILEDVATLSVGIFVFYVVYKATKSAIKLDFSETLVDF